MTLSTRLADAATLADELPNARFVAAESVFEWRTHPERIDAYVFEFLMECFDQSDRMPRRRHRCTARRATMER